MPSIHDAAARGYSARAETYRSGRPDYPAEVAGWLRDVIGLAPGRVVVDLGAGTGKFLPWLRGTGARTIAVEPVAAMRDKLAADNPDIECLAGTAEAIPLPPASADAVICAQSFHWFANAAALAEIRRVLAPGGMLGLIWNVRDESVDWVARLSAITDAHQGDAPRYKSGAWRNLFPAEGFAAVGEAHFRHAHIGPADQVVLDRTLSTSFIAALPPAGQEAVAARVRALIASTPALAGEETAFPYETAAFAFRKTD
ncbi:methyltransferase [Sphingomonas sp. MM-1]|uniref:class I SAM-dependent methyltransferase n=1 Tax=Sphingomonas sp. MM-1 TaxID=745310 RepID=UPI0002C07272|nr:class I SAM-dependent methyltransferase [Sphingomonas sp. MM-1]AGH49225.1 methyltransferase [Sphingomonas sp. MM-1]